MEGCFHYLSNSSPLIYIVQIEDVIVSGSFNFLYTNFPYFILSLLWSICDLGFFFYSFIWKISLKNCNREWKDSCFSGKFWSCVVFSLAKFPGKIKNFEGLVGESDLFRRTEKWAVQPFFFFFWIYRSNSEEAFDYLVKNQSFLDYILILVYHIYICILCWIGIIGSLIFYLLVCVLLGVEKVFLFCIESCLYQWCVIHKPTCMYMLIKWWSWKIRGAGAIERASMIL